MDADVDRALVAAVDPNPAVFPGSLALRAKRPALNVHRVLHSINPPVALLDDMLALGDHLTRPFAFSEHFKRSTRRFLEEPSLVSCIIP